MLAHSCNFQGDRHELVTHLRAVAGTARGFGAAFKGSDPAYYAGLWHDLGKFNPAFQTYLSRCEADSGARGSGPDHKGAGAVLAYQHLPPLSLLIQGHHGGLRSRVALKNWVAERENDSEVTDAIESARAGHSSGRQVQQGGQSGTGQGCRVPNGRRRDAARDIQDCLGRGAGSARRQPGLG